MEFATKAQREVYDRIGEWMQELFGMFARPLPGFPAYLFQQGNTLAQITVFPWGDDDATVAVRSYVVHEVEPTAELLHHLLRQNARFRFGGFGLDDDDDVFFEYTIVGSTSDPEELKAAVLAVANTSDRYAEELIPMYGGIRTTEKIEENARARS